MKNLLAAASAIVLALGGLAVAIPASAATPTPSPDSVLVYTGTSTTSAASDPGTALYSSSAVATVDCGSGHCLITSISIDGSVHGTGIQQMYGGKPPSLDHGKGTFSLSAYNTICSDDEYLPAGVFTVDISTTTFNGVYNAEAQPTVQCPQAERGQPATVLTFVMALTSGTACLIDSSCPTPTPTPTVTTLANGGTAPGRSTGPRAASVPSVLSVLPTVVKAFTVRNSIWAAAAAVVLVLLIAIPTHFFNEAAGKTSELFERWWRKRRPVKTDRKAKPLKPVRLAGWPLAAGGVAAASIISAFVDPRFGFDAASARTFASILVSFVVDVCIGWFVLLFVVRKTHPASTARFEFKPLTLLIVVVAVLFSRLTDFQPGIVFGLVAGIAFGGLLATAEKARVALIGLGWSFGIGVIAWVGYSLTSVHAVFLHETLSGIAIAGSSSLPIALLPVRGLTGGVVWRWKRWVWALAYGVGLFAFMVMLMPMPFSWQSVPINLVVWIVLYLAYAVVAIGLWLLVERPWKKEESGGGSVDRAAEAPVS
ncbi:MAG: hypothetical protein JWN80_1620 [Microbacteriaceae bacterium]|nr:hypothetical protein [Microbacteriaceae bacterium]